MFVNMFIKLFVYINIFFIKIFQRKLFKKVALFEFTFC